METNLTESQKAELAQRGAVSSSDLLGALETALRQWEFFSDEKRYAEGYKYLAEADDYEAKLYKVCKAALRSAPNVQDE